MNGSTQGLLLYGIAPNGYQQYPNAHQSEPGPLDR